MQRLIAATNLENQSLKSLISNEKELREDRNVEETHALIIVHEDLKQTNFMMDEEKKKTKK